MPVMARPLLSTSPVRARDTHVAATEELSSRMPLMCVAAQSFPGTHSQSGRVVGGDKATVCWVLAWKRIFPCFPYVGRWMSQPRQRSFIKWMRARGISVEVTVPCLAPSACAGHSGRHSPWQGPAGEGWAVSLHTSCSHYCSKSKSRGILSSTFV